MINGFKLMGIATRTSNRNNRLAHDISKLWQHFYQEDVFEQIPDKISNDVYAIYTDYASDYTEDYTIMIGVLVSTFANTPDELTGRQFEKETFKVFTAKGDMPEAVINTWMAIWKDDNLLNRKYTYDYEVYGPKCRNGKDSEVNIFISVK